MMDRIIVIAFVESPWSTLYNILLIINDINCININQLYVISYQKSLNYFKW